MASSATYGAPLGNLVQAWGQLESVFGAKPFPKNALSWEGTTGYAVTNFERALLNGPAWQKQAWKLYSTAPEAANYGTISVVAGSGQIQNVANAIISVSNIIVGSKMSPENYWKLAQKYWKAAQK